MKGVILYCNSAVYRKGGYAKGEFTGKHFSKIASVRLKDIPNFIRVLNSIVRGKIPEPFEAIYQYKDGTTGWTELHIGRIKVGGKQRILVIQHDTTERRQAEEALRESEEKFRTLFNTMSEGVALIDKNGEIMLTNPAAESITGFKRQAVEKHRYDSPDWPLLRPDGTRMPPEEMAGPRTMREKNPIRDMVMGVEL